MSQRVQTMLVGLIFIAIVAVVNWPLVLHLPTHVIGRSFEDAFEVLWLLDWTHDALIEQGGSPFFTPDIYYPHGWYTASGAQPVWWMIIFTPLTHLFGPTLTYNLVMLATFVIGGGGVYRLVQSLTQNNMAGILAGCVYIVAPVLTLRQGGHLHILLSAQWLPYLALYCHKAMTENNAGRSRSWLGAGIVSALSVLGHWQFLFMSPLIPLCVIGFTPSTATFKQRLVLTLRIGLVAGILIAPFIMITWYARAQMFPGGISFRMSESDVYSLSLDRLWVPSFDHPLWGNWSRQTFPVTGEACAVSIGYAASILALYAVLRCTRAQAPYLALTVLSVVLAMGITLHWNAQPITVPLPNSVAPFFRAIIGRILEPDLLPSGNQIVLPMPTAVLYRGLPLLASARGWSRYMIVGMMGIAVLTGWGWQTIRIQGSLEVVLGIVVVGIVLFEGLTAPYRNFTPVSANERMVNTWLAHQSERVSLIEYPLPSVNKLALYSQSLHKQQVVNGYMSNDAIFYAQAQGDLGTWPNPKALPILHAWGINYVLVNGNAGETFQRQVLPAIQSLEGLCEVKTFAGSFMSFTEVHVFQVMRPETRCN